MTSIVGSAHMHSILYSCQMVATVATLVTSKGFLKINKVEDYQNFYEDCISTAEHIEEANESNEVKF